MEGMLGAAAVAGDLTASLAEADDVPAPLSHWRRGYALAAMGRYGDAFQALDSVGERDAVVAAAADASRASILRQVSLHDHAEPIDRRALRRLHGATAGVADTVRAAVVIGLVADGVGLGSADLAARLADAARAAAGGDWRPSVRFAWVRGEVASVANAPLRARAAFSSALRRARRRGARRHELKSRGFLAAVQLATGRPRDAVATAAQVADEAAAMGALPLRWPALLVLAQGRADAGDSDASAARIHAAAVLLSLLDTLPSDLRRAALQRSPARDLLA